MPAGGVTGVLLPVRVIVAAGGDPGGDLVDVHAESNPDPPVREASAATNRLRVKMTVGAAPVSSPTPSTLARLPDKVAAASISAVNCLVTS